MASLAVAGSVVGAGEDMGVAKINKTNMYSMSVRQGEWPQNAREIRIESDESNYIRMCM